MSKVFLKTEKDGATIIYQPKARNKKEQEAKQVTDGEEEMPVGTYYIWAKRGFDRTSADKEVRLYREQETVDIVEFQQ